jgi:hypothetical protein
MEQIRTEILETVQQAEGQEKSQNLRGKITSYLRF